MSKATSYNKGSIFDINFDDRTWYKLEDMFNEQEGVIFRIEGLFINENSKFGARPFVAFDKIYLADLPQHMTETIREMIGDPEVVEEINDGKVGFTVRAYMSKTYKKECYSIRFVDYK